MKELRYLVFLPDYGFFKKSNNNEEWEFSKNLKDAKKFKTITGAFVRLNNSDNIEIYNDLKKIILVEETKVENGIQKIKIINELEYKTKDKLISEKEITLSENEKLNKKTERKSNIINVDEKLTTEVKVKRKRTKKETTDDIKEEPKLDTKNKLNSEIKTESSNITVVSLSTDDDFWD